ncbi:hypothetical protein [Pontibacter sp. SGAir0037]|uniref:hypothetical protein n=1 Tax=Pontibacter sp. SGAir0037 TaxID=2571030 RepID=UPI0010CCB18E|nr:hypothetical protein [Pontibacter sp. SGAir0037]QCR22279.1 hypothetical protein C1N53_07970 [Pontibacter sp. SGAir0037]
MIIFQNGLISLDYNPSTDILTVDLPNAITFGVPELNRSLELVAEHVRNYDIKKLLLDSSHVLVDQIEDDTYKRIVTRFVEDLTKSRLEKVARVNSSIHSAETRAVAVTSEASDRTNAAMQIRMFSGKYEALNWLLS